MKLVLSLAVYVVIVLVIVDVVANRNPISAIQHLGTYLNGKTSE